MRNMFALSIFLHMSTSDLLAGSVLEYSQVYGDISLYLASLAWTGLLFRAEIVRLFYVLHFLPVFGAGGVPPRQRERKRKRKSNKSN